MAVILSDMGEACGRSGRTCLLPPRLGELWTKLITFPKEALQLVEMEATFTKQQLDALSISESETRGCCLSGLHRVWQPLSSLGKHDQSPAKTWSPGRVVRTFRSGQAAGRPAVQIRVPAPVASAAAAASQGQTGRRHLCSPVCPSWEKPGKAHSFLEQSSPPPVPGNPRVGSCGGRTHRRACCGCWEVALSEGEERLTPGPLGGGHLP